MLMMLTLLLLMMLSLLGGIEDVDHADYEDVDQVREKEEAWRKYKDAVEEGKTAGGHQDCHKYKHKFINSLEIY